jgi:hypothetical protein
MPYTYIHCRESDGKPFYIGKGSRHDRLKLRSGRSERWTRTAEKHGFRAHVVARWATEEEAFEHEKFLIACFRDMGVDLVNHTDGGEGAPGCKQSEATKALRNAKLRGMKKPAATIARMRAAQAGKVVDAEMRKRIADTLRGRYVGEKNPTAKPVQCVETGAVFGCMSDAAAWLQSLGHAKASFKNISSAVCGEKKTAYGYRWRAA